MVFDTDMLLTPPAVRCFDGHREINQQIYTLVTERRCHQKEFRPPKKIAGEGQGQG
jgi:hypothetical protein